MEKPTEGPYRVCGGYTPSYIAIDSRDGYIVFGMADRMDHKEHGQPIKAPSFEAQRANARLLAASWEMLHVCRELDKLKWCASWEGDGRNETIVTRALGMARAVLAKVEPKGEDES